jgi:hypothetical protein
MSDLKNIVFFFVAFQLTLSVVNHIQILPPSADLPGGLYLNTGQIKPWLNNFYDPLTDIIESLSSTAVSFNAVSAGGSNIIDFKILRIGFVNPNLLWSVDTTFNVFGLPFGILELLISLFIIGACALFTWVFSAGFAILGLILNATVGAVPFWMTLFMLLDPTMGAILGLAVGAMQMIYVVWGLIGLIPGEKEG